MTEQSMPEKTFGIVWPMTTLDAFQGQTQNLINETQKTMAAWMGRCQEATTASVRSFLGLYAHKDPAAFASAYGEWLTKSMTLMAEQMYDAQEDVLHCAAIARQFVSTAFPSVPEPGRAKPDRRAEVPHARSAAE